MHLTDHEISHYVDALRSNTEHTLPNIILEHVEECLECKHAILELAAIVGEIENTEELEPAKAKPEPFKRNVSFYWKAAVVATTILLPSYFYLFQHNADQQKNLPVITQKPVASEQEKKAQSSDKYNAVNEQNTFAQNNMKEDPFTPIAEYEAVCGERFRSEKIDIISPTMSEAVKESIKFNILFQKKQNRTIGIFNNKNVRVFYVLFDEVTFVREVKLPRGLYYWKLETPADLLYLGKFVVNK